MDYKRIVQGILDIGEEMLVCGAENFRLEDSLYRMCKSYGFVQYDVFVIPSNLQITIETPEGEIITQIRHIESTDMNFDRLDYLNNLCRYVCKNKPDAPGDSTEASGGKRKTGTALVYAVSCGGDGRNRVCCVLRKQFRGCAGGGDCVVDDRCCRRLAW